MTKTEYRIPRLAKAATSFTNRNGETVAITGPRNFGSGGYNLAQLRHMDPSDDFSVYEDMDVTITLNAGTDRERTQLIKVPAPANQWRYWHRRLNGGS
tara:strand:- start:760 stop:1053 length:294 start_codon:yes stop_codon:yes gene_type:complete